MSAAAWPVLPLKRLLRPVSPGAVAIKGSLADLGESEGYPAYSASGQDVRVEVPQFSTDGIVLSAVGAQCGKCFHARGAWSVVANTQPFLPTEKADARFMFYVVNQPNFWEIGGSAQPYVQVPRTLPKPVPVPSLDTQKHIAAFLDEKTARIDALIAKKQTLLERLAEKRQAIITKSVTKGLNPTAPMKDSGIDWLGQIPAHWEVKRLKFVGDTILGLTYSPFEVVNEGEGLLVLRSSNVQNGKLAWGDNVFVQTKVPDELIVRAGDILICSRNGSRALIGKNAVITEEYAGQTFGAFMTVFRTPMHRFIHLVLNSELFAFQSGRFMTSTINQLTVNAIKDFAVPIPPAAEQNHIADAVHESLIRLDHAADEISTSIDRLREYRSALITAAVTGQIAGLQ